MKCAKRKIQNPVLIKKQEKMLKIEKMSMEEKAALNQVLLENRAVQFHVVDQFCDNFIPPSLPTRLNSIFNPRFATGKTYEEIVLECNRLLKDLLVTPEQSKEAERLTVKQRKSHFWNDVRIGYCTGSSMYQICRTDINKPSISLIKKICFPGKTLTTPAIL